MAVKCVCELKFMLEEGNTQEVLEKIALMMKGRSELRIDVYSVAVSPIKTDSSIAQLS